MAKRLWYVTARDFDIIKDDVEDLQDGGVGSTQDLSIVGQVLSLTDGGSVTLPDTNTQLSQADIEAMGFSTVDNDTQLIDADIAALGYLKTDTNTQLTDLEVEAIIAVNTAGFVTTDNNTQLSQSEIEAMGFSTSDTNTQLTKSDIEAFGFSTTDNNDNTQLSDADIAAFGYVKTDNNTQLSQSDIEAMGFSTIDNDTQLTDGDIAAFGYVKTDNNTQLSDGDIAAFGYVKTDNDTQRTDLEIQGIIDLNTNGYVTTDNNTQLSDADIAALGYVKTDTQLSDGDIAAFGYVKTDNDTQLTDLEVEAIIAVNTAGFVTTDNNTQLTDGEIEALGYLKTPAVLPLAKGGALNLQQSLLAADGQPAKNILAVAATSSGKVQGCSLGNGNVVEVYADGADYNSNTVLYREFMQAGEPICFTGLSAGAIITSTQGFYGVSEQVVGSQESPMPLMSLGLAFTDTFCYAFRNSNGSGNDIGQIYIVCGPLPAEVTLTRNGSVVNSQENIALEPFEIVTLLTDANAEFRIQSTSPVMGAIQARMGPGGQNRFYDARLVMPTTNDGITYPRSGFVSAPYNNTAVDYYVRDGASGDFTASPNSPANFATETGADDSDYEPAGATRVLAKGLISAYSGADSAGLEASPLMPTAAMSQVVAQPFHIDDSGDGGNSGVAIASPYTGTARVYEWNSTTGVADLAYTVALNKGVNGAGITLTTLDDQNFPASGIIANEAGLAADSSYVELVGDLGAGYIVADVPITVVVQNANPSLVPSIRSQNGTTTTSIISDDDETLTLGWTPPNIKAEITTDVDGYLRRREIDASGVITYPLV